MSKPTRMSQLDKVFERCSCRQAFVGLDVHKQTIHAAVWLDGAIGLTWVMPATVQVVVATLAAHAAKIALVVYEAGPTGSTP